MWLPLFFPGRSRHDVCYIFRKERRFKHSPSETVYCLSNHLETGVLTVFTFFFFFRIWKLARYTIRAMLCFCAQRFQGCAGEGKGRMTSISLNFPEDLEKWALLCVAFLCKILINSFQFRQHKPEFSETASGLCCGCALSLTAQLVRFCRDLFLFQLSWCWSYNTIITLW